MIVESKIWECTFNFTENSKPNMFYAFLSIDKYYDSLLHTMSFVRVPVTKYLCCILKNDKKGTTLSGLLSFLVHHFMRGGKIRKFTGSTNLFFP